MGIFKRQETDQWDALAGQEDISEKKEKPMSVGRKENTVSLRTDEITTILGKGSEFEGKLSFEGTLRIEGSFSGEIHSESILVVGEGAKVSAEINIGTIIINGEVRGNIHASQGIEIRGSGRFFGNMETPALQIEKGVLFEGNCKMQSGNAKPVGSPFASLDNKKGQPPVPETNKKI